ncbi:MULTISPECIES: HemK2/MTQ2 family protein methyltransferase [Streptomyces]|uniref:HemK2/MTQ2 family protein methyltransferase n=2 Tax=Streptomyces ardesiacus TaxID=285564 RepID=A0ABW8HG35_9ACTN|nr:MULTISPECIES: HemK2/MTQ2 family protein methyltransferase [Streptomyces]KOU03524.1 methyltransferase [Streptomyces sp. NRRL F-4711]KOX30697.1 methyltransferase [Streptomyces sp. NRRL F-4707]KOX47365.1 methyltransferase [Streptomyces sp. NRRL F-7442]MCL7367348.1 methyltransferase [Streptomyces ardesiacus]
MGSVNFTVLPGVYAPQDDTALLAGALSDESLPPGAAVLDVGTGTGALALAAALRGGRVTAVDVSWRAVCAARLNAARAGVRIRVRHGNLFTPVRGESFDLVLANPPYVPAPAGGRRPRGAARAWDAGHDGRMVLDRICRQAPGLLRPGGVLLLVQSALSDPARTEALLREAGLKAAVTRRRRIAFGPVVRGRERWLRQRGLLSVAEYEEELVVVRAELPV